MCAWIPKADRSNRIAAALSCNSWPRADMSSEENFLAQVFDSCPRVAVHQLKPGTAGFARDQPDLVQHHPTA
jgi:hypothetical protein